MGGGEVKLEEGILTTVSDPQRWRQDMTHSRKQTHHGFWREACDGAAPMFIFAGPGALRLLTPLLLSGTYFEVPFDSNMNRTKNRPLVRGQIR
ncbi:hypothetical protein JZ751_009111 [Albula glossodonta]|uniref:Uncharacterized protein n=1 Tax=Albula glossodonta TaxID=121402 RepID=A0A8T2N0X7_9TELE|nr:hypothetical protein JZ751_009111 [Albula glossodonta]